MLKINGVAAPTPSALRMTIFDVSSSVNRNAAGNAVMDMGAVKRKMELNWAHMSAAELAALLKEMNGFFEVDYPEPETGEEKHMCCYCSDRTMGILRMMDGEPIWTDIKMTWTQR